MSFITSPGVIVPPLTAGAVAYGTGGQAKVNSVGTAGQFLQSAGAGVPIWADGSAVKRVVRTSNTILATTNNSNLISYTSGTFTQTFDAAATLGNGWYCFLQNSGTGVITLDPNGAELIDGLISYAMYPGESRLVQCTGTAFFSVVLSPFLATFTTSSTFITPPGYTQFGVRMWGGGAGGNGGINNTIGTNRNGGGAGGGGGQNFGNIIAPAAGTSITATIGAGGTGRAGGTWGGGSGGTSTLVGYMSAFGGSNAGNAAEVGGGGGGSLSSSTFSGGAPKYLLFYDTTLTPNLQYVSVAAFGFGGSPNQGATSTDITNANIAIVGCSENGGSGGGGSSGAGTVGRSGGRSMNGATGGGQGASVDTLNVVYAGGDGGGVGYQIINNGTYIAGTGMGGGAAAGVGAVGTAGSVLSTGSGGGGGGGGGNALGTGYAGGAGATPGGGGGGGGAGLNTSGAGGNGGGGQINIVGVA